MVNIIAGAHTPDNVITLCRQVVGLIAFITITTRTITGAFATTVIVTDDVVSVVRRVAAGAYPCNGRKFGARRAGRGRATT